MPRTIGPYNVAMATTQLIDYSHNEPFAPAPGIPKNLDCPFSIPPPRTVPLASPNTSIADPPTNSSNWPVLLFSPSYRTTRFLCTSILRQISSNGFVVVAFDTAYDTSVLTLANGTVLYGNTSSYLSTDEGVTTTSELRVQAASSVADSLNSSIGPLIPACGGPCINTTHVAMFGHSIGGAASAAVMLNDTRIIGGLSKHIFLNPVVLTPGHYLITLSQSPSWPNPDYDGELLGPVVQTGFSYRPFAIFATGTQGMHSPVAQNELKSWPTICPLIRSAPKWWLLLNDSLHYTFSDFPLILPKLDVEATKSIRNDSQITDADPVRTEKALVAYTTAFFRFVFSERLEGILEQESKEWPEVVFDTVDLGPRDRNGNVKVTQPGNGGTTLFQGRNVGGIGKAIMMAWVMIYVA